MSLSNRVLAGFGAVLVIGVGTVGGSIAYATGQDAPAKSQATVTIGTSTDKHHDPSCYNGGDPLDKDALTKCNAVAKAAAFPVLSIKPSDRIGVAVNPDAAKNGWLAYTDGGTNGQAVVAKDQKNNTYSGSLPASSVLSGIRKTTLTVIEKSPKSDTDIIAVWFYTLENKDAPLTAPAGSQPQDQQQQQQQQSG